MCVKYRGEVEERSSQLVELETRLREEKEEQRRQLDLLDQEVCTPSVCVCGGGRGEGAGDTTEGGEGGTAQAAGPPGPGGLYTLCVCVWGGGGEEREGGGEGAGDTTEGGEGGTAQAAGPPGPGGL